MKLKTIFIPVLLILIWGCEEKEDNKLKYEFHKISPVLKSFNFRQGSAWTYMEINSGKTDQVELIKTSVDTDFIGCSSFDTECIDFIYKVFEFETEYASVINAYAMQFEQLQIGPYDIIYFDHAVKKTLKKAVFMGTIDSIQIRENTFRDAELIKCEPDEWITDTTLIYYVKNIGIIKSEIKKEDGNEVWELTGWNVQMDTDDYIFEEE